MYSRPGVGNGLHRQMTVRGKRRNVSRDDIESLAVAFTIARREVENTFRTAHEAATAWETICGQLGIAPQRGREIRDTWEFPHRDFVW
jgi:hypothetical protein